MVSTPTTSPERTDSEEVMLPPRRRTQDTDSRVVPRLGAKKGPEYFSGHKSFFRKQMERGSKSNRAHWEQGKAWDEKGRLGRKRSHEPRKPIRD